MSQETDLVQGNARGPMNGGGLGHLERICNSMIYHVLQHLIAVVLQCSMFEDV